MRYLLVLGLLMATRWSVAQMTISEVNYNPEPSFDADDWVEFWNTDPLQAVNLTGWYFTDSNPGNKYTFPANTVVPANGRLVAARNTVKFSAKHPGVAPLGSFGFGLSGAGGDAVRLYNDQKVLVAEVTYADSLPWPAGADGQGRTMELKDPSASLNDPANWFDGCIGGSPGAAYSPCQATIVFSEINYTSDTLNHDTGDWVELRNISNQPVSLSNWTFKDGSDSAGHTFTLPAGAQLAAHANLVLAQDAAKFSALHPQVTNMLGSFVFGLSSKGEWIRAYDATGLIRLSVRYDNKAPWDTTANGAGFTLELKDSTGVMNSGFTWFAGCRYGSPGQHYQPCDTTNAIAPGADMLARLWPNPARDRIEVTLRQEVPSQAVLYDAAGRQVLFTEQTTGHFALDVAALPDGLYLLHLRTADRHSTRTILKTP